MLITLSLRKGSTPINLNRSQKPYKILGRAKAIKDASLSELSGKDRIRILVFGLELTNGKGDIKDELVYWTGLLDDRDILGMLEVTTLQDGGM